MRAKVGGEGPIVACACVGPKRTFDRGEYQRIESEMIYVQSKLKALSVLFAGLGEGNHIPPESLSGVALILDDITDAIDGTIWPNEQGERT